MKPAVILDGWGAIGAHLEDISGLARTERTLRRWASLDRDPLPVRRTPGGRDVYAERDAVTGWWRRWCDRLQKLGGDTTEGPIH